MFLTVQDKNTELTMTHLQFANITGKRNDSVIRTMKTLSEQGVISLTQSVERYVRGNEKKILAHYMQLMNVTAIL